jgi:copper chaperone CopZ
MDDLRFVVEQAGCESCAERVRSALSQLVTIDSISIDEASDTATVVARADASPSLDALDAALADASAGSGHTYRLRR